jgi:hypothetical protein
MAKRTKMPTDLNQRAKAIVDLATGEAEPDEKDEAKAAGGRKGAQARSDALSPEQRSEIARNAADTRWRRSRGDGEGI